MDLAQIIIRDIPTASTPGFERPSTPPEFEEARLQSAAGDLAAVQDAVERLRQRSYNPLFKRRLHDCFHAAIKNGRVDVASYLISQGVDITDLDFAVATKLKSYPVLQLLLDYGWDINAPMHWDEPPALQYAIEDEDLTIWFLNHGAQPDAEASILDLTPLSFAVARAPFKIIKLLFEKGGSTQHGQLLHHAVLRENSDHLEVIDFLLDHGAPLNDIMYQNRPNAYMMMKAFGLGTPLHKAADFGRLDVVKHLVNRGADPLIPDARRKLAIELAESSGHEQVVEYLRPFSSSPAVPRQYFTDPYGYHV